MINTSGKIIVVDADALIGLINETDTLHQRCVKIYHYLNEEKFIIIVPYLIVLEAATALSKSKRIKRPDLAHRILQKYAATDFYPLSHEKVPQLVAKLYHPKTSKKNSPFDYYLLALAKTNNIKFVFSFDSFYQKHGLTLIESLLS